MKTELKVLGQTFGIAPQTLTEDCFISDSEKENFTKVVVVVKNVMS